MSPWGGGGCCSLELIDASSVKKRCGKRYGNHDYHAFLFLFHQETLLQSLSKCKKEENIQEN